LPKPSQVRGRICILKLGPLSGANCSGHLGLTDPELTGVPH
jgi:hypothetical protein